MSPDTWTAINAIAAVVAAICTFGTVFAVYHVRRLDTQFHVKCEVQRSEIAQVLCVHMIRDKIGGHSGRITGLRVERRSGVRISTKRPSAQVGVQPYGGGWESPDFGLTAELNIPISPVDKQIDMDCWITSDQPTEFRASLLITYHRYFFKSQAVSIFGRTLPSSK